MNVTGTNGNVQNTVSATQNAVTEGEFAIFTAASTAGQIGYVFYAVTFYIKQTSGGAMLFTVAPPGGFGGSTVANNSSLTAPNSGTAHGGAAAALVPANGFAFVSITGKTVLGPGATFQIPYFFDNHDASNAVVVNFNVEYEVTYQS
jgi:hypothetical protein